MKAEGWAWTVAAGLGVLLFGAFTVASIQRADAQVEVWRLQGEIGTQTRTIVALRKQLETATTISYVQCAEDVGPQKQKAEAKRVTPVFPYAKSVQ